MHVPALGIAAGVAVLIFGVVAFVLWACLAIAKQADEQMERMELGEAADQ